MGMIIGSAVGGLVLGLVIAYVNALITRKASKQTNVMGVMAGNMARFLLDIVALAVGFAVCKLTGLPYVPVLVAIAIGLSVGGLLFLRLLVGKMSDTTGEKRTPDGNEDK